MVLISPAMPRLGIVMLAVAALGSNARAEPAKIVTVASVSDVSGETDPDWREHDVELVSTSIAPPVAAIDAEARRLELEARQLDVSIARIDVTQEDGKVHVTAEIRVVISDADGRMLSLLSSCASVEVSATAYRPSRLARMRDRALEDASAGIAESVRAKLLRDRRPNA